MATNAERLQESVPTCFRRQRIGRLLAIGLLVVQAPLAARVALRLLRTRGGTKIESGLAGGESPKIAIIVPVLNEISRLSPCLDGLNRQGPVVAEIIVADGGSTDGTQEMVRHIADGEPRLRLLQCPPAEPGINGKAHNLQHGFAAVDPALPWILTIDADVRPGPVLAASLLRHAEREHVTALSVATHQHLSGATEGLLHPAMLATLVYRYGIPGRATADPGAVQANGQCFLVQREPLLAAGGFAAVLDSVCEDVTLARKIAANGERVGFYETATDDLIGVAMYASAGEAWRNWLRSLPMRDQFWGPRGAVGLAEVALVQAAPLPLALCLARYGGLWGVVGRANLALATMRLGVLCGTARAYPRRSWTYWLSPVSDVPVAIGLLLSAMRRVHQWRGRRIVRGEPR